MKYLRSKSYYNDLYDIFTIKDYLRTDKRFPKSKRSLQKIKAPKESKLEAYFLAHNLLLYHKKGEEYRRKEKTIQKWMEDDRRRDEKLEGATPPNGIYCNHCGEKMELESKYLHDIIGDSLRVVFFFECRSCNKRRLVFENGEERERKPYLCPKCRVELKSKVTRRGDVITTKYNCSGCGYKETDVWDLNKSKQEREEKEKTDRELLRKYRSKYCLSDKEGQEYILQVERFKQLTKMLKESQRKQKDPACKKAKKLKKLKVLELEKLLRGKLEKESYINLQFDKPEINRYVIVPFAVQEADSKREEYDSKNNLKKLIKKILGKTNWRLMSEGISYRLGYLNGRLKGYESEKDLIGLVKNE